MIYNKKNERSLDDLLKESLKDSSAIDLNEFKKLLLNKPIDSILKNNIDLSLDNKLILERFKIFQKLYPLIKNILNELKITSSLLSNIFEIYIPIASYMADQSQKKVMTFGISGAQGSGKTTMSKILEVILTETFKKNVAVVSLDDFYKTYEERSKMSQKVHPLFKIRSVAGTHDTKLLELVLNNLISSTPDSKIKIPRFCKMAKNGDGDRLPKNDWNISYGKTDIILFEGWMIGATPQSEVELTKPINVREQDEDPDIVWRKTSNQILRTEYQSIFSKIDDLFFIKVKDTKEIFRNRELQEKQLRETVAYNNCDEDKVYNVGAMTKKEVLNFIMLFERTSSHMLKTVPEKSKVTIYLDRDHVISKIKIKNYDSLLNIL